MDRARRAGIYPADYRLTPFEIDLQMADGMAMDLGDGLQLTALATPGHAAGHLSFVLEAGPARLPGGRCSAATPSSRAG